MQWQRISITVPELPYHHTVAIMQLLMIRVLIYKNETAYVQ